MATDHPVQAVVGLTGFRADSARVQVTREHFARFELPQSVSVDDVAVMQKDFEVLAEIAAQYPQDLTDLHNAVLAHDFGTANELAERIGMTEEQISARGGGEIGVVIGIVGVLAIAALIIGHHTPSTAPPRPVGPNPPGDAGTEGGSDAGADG